VHAGPKVEIIDSPIPTPGPDQVVTKVIVSGSNPKDWKVAEWVKITVNQGDDIAGIVHSVGSNVTEFKPGDRIAAFHEMTKPGGSYAEYALSWAHTTFHIPSTTSFEEAAAIPLAAMTAALGLFQRLGLPEPWKKATVEQAGPLLVYGGSTAVGSYALQLAKKAEIHPLIVVAGRAQGHVKQFLDPSKGDVVLDYRNGEDALLKGIKDALKGRKLNYAFDAVSEHGSYQTIVKVLEPNGKITLVLPGKKYEEIPESVQKSITSVGAVFNSAEDMDFGFAYFRYFGRGLAQGWFKGHPTELVPGGLGGIQQALQNLKDGKASAVKYVFRIEDTEGVRRSSL